MVAKRDIGITVFDAALRRLIEQYEQGHTVVVSISGGKDSTVCLELAVLAATLTKRLPVNAVVQDEEIAYPGTYEYLERVHARDDVNLRWLVPRQPMMNMANRVEPYFWTFDARLSPDKWVRRFPDFATEIEEQCITELTIPERFPVAEGKQLIDVIGLRVQESQRRLLGVVTCGGHLTKEVKQHGVPYRKLRPIYDWRDDDVWKAILENQWDYNKAYDVMLRMGVLKSKMRVSPPTMNEHGLATLKWASSAWPKWFDRLSARLPGVKTAAQFGLHAVRPVRRLNETWKECFHRVCIDDAPAPHISERSTKARDWFLAKHAIHSHEPFPEVEPCKRCGGGSIASWKKLAHICWNGDPYGSKLDCCGLFAIEPQYFRRELEGTRRGVWGGKPTW